MSFNRHAHVWTFYTPILLISMVCSEPMRERSVRVLTLLAPRGQNFIVAVVPGFSVRFFYSLRYLLYYLLAIYVHFSRNAMFFLPSFGNVRNFLAFPGSAVRDFCTGHSQCYFCVLYTTLNHYLCFFLHLSRLLFSSLCFVLTYFYTFYRSYISP